MLGLKCPLIFKITDGDIFRCGSHGQELPVSQIEQIAQIQVIVSMKGTIEEQFGIG